MTTVKDVAAEVMALELVGKKWYTSKTVWANAFAIAAVAAQTKYGFIIGLEWQTLFLSGINLVLRKITKEEIVW